MSWNTILGIMMFALYSGVTVAAILDDVEDADVRAVRSRLEEERAERLLMRNDLDLLMLKVAQLERRQKETTAPVSTDGVGSGLLNPFKSQESDPIAFTARLGGTHTLLDSLHVVVFDQVVYNQGDGYNPSTGIFTAPKTGTYIFTVSVMTVNKDNYVHLQLMVNDKEVGRLFCGDHTSNWADHGSVSVTVRVEAMDQVFVRVMPSVSGRLHGDNYSSFTGVIIL